MADAERHRRTARPRAALIAGRRDWFKIQNNAGTGVAQIHVYDEIGYYGVTASDFVAQLSALDAQDIELHLNSPGGEIFDGVAIYNALRSHPANVTTYVDSLAASIASVIALAGDKVVMAPHSEMMIHNASGLCIGNASDMRGLADMLDRQSDKIAGIYAERAGGTVNQWRKAMDAESWYSAKEAVAAGLADEVSSGAPPLAAVPDLAASWDLSIFRYKGREAAPAPGEAVVNQAPEPNIEPAEPEPVAEADLSGWDVSMFRAAVADAANDMRGYDPDTFRQAVRAQAETAPANPAPRPEPLPAPVARKTEPVPEPEPEGDPEFAGWDPAIFRAAVEMQANTAPAPTMTSPEPTPDPDPYDPTVLFRSLREAMK